MRIDADQANTMVREQFLSADIRTKLYVIFIFTIIVTLFILLQVRPLTLVLRPYNMCIRKCEARKEFGRMNEKLELLLLLLLSSHVCLHSQTVSALNVDWVRVYQLKYTTYFLLCGQCMNTHHGQSEPSERILDSKKKEDE